jgi:hypothetical protein
MPPGTTQGGQSLYAQPRSVTDPSQCYFYHTIDLPGLGVIEGGDLRAGIDAYLGAVDFRDQRVLEIGTANGLLCFEMERRGADVVAYDLSSAQRWDIVPYEQYDYMGAVEGRRQHVDRINNAFWLGHRLVGSKAKMAYGSVYDVPGQIGAVDISTFGCVLLHVRDPFLALQSALRLTRSAAIVTEPCPEDYAGLTLTQRVLARIPLRATRRLAALLGMYGLMEFRPNTGAHEPNETWWTFSPDAILRMLGVLGFTRATVSFHTQMYRRSPTRLFTIVASRTHGRAIGEPRASLQGEQKLVRVGDQSTSTAT